jgi:hypothetical protein
MVELEITVEGDQQFIQDSLWMEQNYPGMHRKLIWERFPHMPGILYDSGCLGAIASLPALPYMLLYFNPRENFLFNQQKEVVRSFLQKASGQGGPDYFVDTMAEKLGVKVPGRIVPIDQERVRYRGELAQQGISFKVISG